MTKLKVIAAMSGGVDSAVAAARAVDAGYEVVGVHLALCTLPYLVIQKSIDLAPEVVAQLKIHMMPDGQLM